MVVLTYARRTVYVDGILIKRTVINASSKAPVDTLVMEHRQPRSFLDQLNLEVVFLTQERRVCLILREDNLRIEDGEEDDVRSLTDRWVIGVFIIVK